MPHKHETPASVGALARGHVGGLDELATNRAYRDWPPSREIPAELAHDWSVENDPLHLAWGRAQRILEGFAVVDDEHGELARRMLAIQTGPPIPGAVWDFAWAHSMVIAGLLYGRSPADRARRGKLLAALYAEADGVSAEIGWAA